MAIEARVPLVQTRLRTYIGVVAVGAFLLGVGVLTSIFFSSRDWQGFEPVKEEAETSSTAPESPRVGEVFLVDVSGAVEKPGIYQLSAGSRTGDALVAAGGLSARADRGWVARNINLAQKVSDGFKIYIPLEPDGTGVSGTSAVLGTQSTQQIANLVVSINTASLSELEDLWGVGEVRAQSIIDGRPYGNIDELVTKKIVPKSVVEKNKERLSL